MLFQYYFLFGDYCLVAFRQQADDIKKKDGKKGEKKKKHKKRKKVKKIKEMQQEKRKPNQRKVQGGVTVNLLKGDTLTTTTKFVKPQAGSSINLLTGGTLLNSNRQTKNNIGKAKLPPIPATPAPLKQQNTSLEESTQNGSKKVRNSIMDDDEEKV